MKLGAETALRVEHGRVNSVAPVCVSRAICLTTLLLGCLAGEKPSSSQAHDESTQPVSDPPLTSAEEHGIADEKHQKRVLTDSPSVSSLVVTDLAELEALDERALAAVVRLDIALSPAARASTLIERGVEDPPERSDACSKLDLEHLAARVPRLRFLRLAGCQDALGNGLGAFAELVEELELVDVTLDARLLARLGRLASLRSLTLTRVATSKAPLRPLAWRIRPERIVLRELTPDSPLSELLGQWPRSLREVRLEGPWAGNDAMMELSKAKALRSLAIIDTRIGNFSLHQLKTLGDLSELELAGTTFNDQSPLYVRELPIVRFSCRCPNLGDTGLRSIRHLERLHQLVLPQSRVTDASLSALGELNELEQMTILGRDLGAVAFQALAKLPTLRRLELGKAALQDPGTAGLGELTQLRELVLRYDNLDDRSASQLGKLRELEVLDLGGTMISDAGVTALVHLTKLRELRLHHTRVTNRGLSALRALHELEILELDHTDVVDAAMVHLAQLEKLRVLRLDDTLVTDHGMTHLANLQALERVNLAGTVVTDRGVAKLASLPRLEVLELSRTRANDPTR